VDVELRRRTLFFFMFLVAPETAAAVTTLEDVGVDPNCPADCGSGITAGNVLIRSFLDL